MQQGQMVFTRMERVLFGQTAAEAIVAEAERIQAKRVFVLAGGTLNRQTDEVQNLAEALGSRFAGVFDQGPRRGGHRKRGPTDQPGVRPGGRVHPGRGGECARCILVEAVRTDSSCET